MKNIFLSASIPLPERHPKYYDSADIIAIRDAVIALATLVLGKHRIIWGGHPSITPLIYYVIERIIQNRLDEKGVNEGLDIEDKKGIFFKELKEEISKHVIIYQSKFFEKHFPPDNSKFDNVILTDPIEDDREKSLLHMRDRMLSDFHFSAAIFIGGMDGIEGNKEKEIDGEYKMFKERYPEAIIIPLASTGAATKIVYDNLSDDTREKNERFLKDYGYMSLFQKYLIDEI